MWLILGSVGGYLLTISSISKTIQGFARFTIVKANQSLITSLNNFLLGCRCVVEHFSLIAKVTALTESREGEK